MMNPPSTQHSMSMILAEFLDHKMRINRRPDYLKTLKSYLNQFTRGREFQPVTEVTPEVVEDWFVKRNETPAARCANIGRLSSFFSFCERRRYIESNPMRRIERPYVERKAPVIVSPDEAKKFLDKVHTHCIDLLGYAVLGLMCGIRPHELARMTWDDVSLEPRDLKELKGYGIANVTAAASKVRTRRIVPIPPVALAWLAQCPQEGKLVRYSRTHPIIKPIAAMAGIEWTHDLLRHSAASYLMAKFEDSGRVAHWLGNSPQVLLTHYYQVVTPDDCTAFWAITP